MVMPWDEIEEINRIAVSGLADKMNPIEKFREIRLITQELLEEKPGVDDRDVQVGRGRGKAGKSK